MLCGHHIEWVSPQEELCYGVTTLKCVSPQEELCYGVTTLSGYFPYNSGNLVRNKNYNKRKV